MVTMSLPFHLGLRNERHMVSVIRQTGRSREQLAAAYAPDGDRRHRILAQWGNDAGSPRDTMAFATVQVPLPRRTQAALSYRIDPFVSQRLASGFYGQPLARRDTQPGMIERMHLGVPATLKINTPWAPHPTEAQPDEKRASLGFSQARGGMPQ